jgi:hypothetical protein
MGELFASASACKEELQLSWVAELFGVCLDFQLVAAHDSPPYLPIGEGYQELSMQLAWLWSGSFTARTIFLFSLAAPSRLWAHASWR